MDTRVRHNPLRDWKREVIMIADDRFHFKLNRRYRLSFKGKIVADNLKTLKEVRDYLKIHAK